MRWKTMDSQWVLPHDTVQNIGSHTCAVPITEERVSNRGNQIKMELTCLNNHHGRSASRSDTIGLLENNLLVSADTSFSGITFTQVHKWASISLGVNPTVQWGMGRHPEQPTPHNWVMQDDFQIPVIGLGMPIPEQLDTALVGIDWGSEASVEHRRQDRTGQDRTGQDYDKVSKLLGT